MKSKDLSASAYLAAALQLSYCCTTSFAWNCNAFSSNKSFYTNQSISQRRSVCRHALTNDNDATPANDDKSSDAITNEIERLQQQLRYIEALEERNKAQIDSFIDEQDQWDSMEEDERQLLLSKGDIEKKLEQITSELVSMWMGGKSMEG
jgi:hypothetical protein